MSNNLVAYRARVHIFGNCSSPSIATIGLRHAIDSSKCEDNKNSKLMQKVTNYVHHNFYVDDGLGCAPTCEDAIAILNETKIALARFNIKLHKIMCNEPSVLQKFPKEDTVQATTFDIDSDSIHRTLGVAWDIVRDEFTVKVDLPDRPFTKRGILAVIASIYDPIGIACPVVLGGKLIQRKILPRKDEDNNLEKYDWDDPLPLDLLEEWQSWKRSIIGLENLKVARCLIPKGEGTYHRSMNVYADASEEAIGHVIYIKTTSELGGSHLSFLYAESKVAPKNANSIPRMELCAAANAAKSAHKICEELSNKPESVHFFSDSRVCLGYIHNTQRRFPMYVSRRIDTILSVSTPEQWKYIHTKQNPADYATRPTSITNLSNSTWLTGPKSLKSDEQYRPNEETYLEDLPEALPEITNLMGSRTNYEPFADVMDKCSSWTKLNNVMKLVLKAGVK